MRNRLLVVLPLVVLASLLVPSLARARASARASFAVVIGNNRSLEHRRPDLHYADDDAARYFSILKTLGPGAAYLLTEFDEDTTRLLPALSGTAEAPTRAKLLDIGQQLAEQISAAAATGVETDLYFVFAGHGDVDEGTGFIELADARFTSMDLERWLRAIHATRAHVILDSCNSFFMLSERRPGGRYYATPEDAVRSLTTHLPNVGVFLSTSAEGESFEWSEIQSGVFSHVVRSGLVGPADADGDGAISYLELAAFVATATADVPNPNMRPHVFARGPGGHDDQPIVPVVGRSGARMFRLVDPGPMRLRMADRNAVPIVDAFQQGGVPLTVTLPEEWADGATVDHSRIGGAEAGANLEHYAVPPTGDVTLASLQPLASRGAARGPAEVFRRLFARPFGPPAVAAYAAELTRAPPPVYGVSREDAQRMDLLLGQIESAEHGQRLVASTFLLAAAATSAGVGATAFAYDHGDPATPPQAAHLAGALDLAIGASFLVGGLYDLAAPWSGERLAADYRDALGRTDYAHAFALADERIAALAAAEKRERLYRGVAGGVVLLGSTAGLIGNELSNPSVSQRYVGRALGGFGMCLGLTDVAMAVLVKMPVEHLTTVWRQDPSRPRIDWTLAPTLGGATAGLTGSF